MANRIYNRRQFGSPSMRQEQRATPENPTFNLNDPEAWATLRGGVESASGVAVTHDKAMTVAAVWQCVSDISGNTAKLRLNVVRDADGDGGDIGKIDKKHPASKIVRRKWNDETPAFIGWRTLMVQALLWPNAYAFIDRNGRGDPAGLYNLLPDLVETPERINGKLWYFYNTTREDGSAWRRPIRFEDMFHIRGISFDSVSGLDFAKYARDALGTAMATEQFQAKYFKSGIRTGGILMLPREMKEKAKLNVEEGFSRSYSGQDNWFKTVILRDGAKFEQAQSSLRDAQMVELEEGLVRKVARFFNVSPSRVGLSDSVSYNSKAEDNQSYLDSTLSPWLMSITSECWMKLLSAANQEAESHEFVHDVSQLLRLDRLKRYQLYAMGRQAQILTINDCRTDDGLPKVPGGDTLDSPTTPAGGMDKGANTPPRGKADDSGGMASASKVRQLVYGVTRNARHKAKDSKAFVTWIDSRFQPHIDEARALVGDSELPDKWLIELRHIAETATATNLPAIVEEWAQQLEAAA